MSDKTYVTAVGFVQFEVKEREANNQVVRDVVLKTPGSQTYVRVTIWPEFEDTIIERGDFVAVDGVFTQSTYQDKEGAKRDSLNISAKTLAVISPAERTESDGPVEADGEAGDLF